MINITPDPKDPYAHYPAAYEAKSKNNTAFRLNYVLTALAAIAPFPSDISASGHI